MTSDLIRSALRTATDTKVVLAEPGAVTATPQVFRECFGDTTAIVVGDERTMAVAGNAVVAALAADEHVTRLDAELSRQHGAALKLMVVAPPPAPPPPAPVPPSLPAVRSIERRSADAAAVTEVMRELQQTLDEDPSLRVDIECRVYRDRGGEA